MYHEEIPYSIMVGITEFKDRGNNLVYINADIIVERESQKIIIIGNKGAGLKKLGERARKDIENFLNKKVYLELFVIFKLGLQIEHFFLKRLYNLFLLRKDPLQFLRCVILLLFFLMLFLPGDSLSFFFFFSYVAGIPFFLFFHVVHLHYP